MPKWLLRWFWRRQCSVSPETKNCAGKLQCFWRRPAERAKCCFCPLSPSSGRSTPAASRPAKTALCASVARKNFGFCIWANTVRFTKNAFFDRFRASRCHHRVRLEKSCLQMLTRGLEIELKARCHLTAL